MAFDARDGGVRAFESERVARVLGRPAVSPDGASLAFARIVDPAAQTTELALFELATSTLRTLSPRDDAEPAFSPDGRYLAYTTLQYGDPEIVLHDLTGVEPLQRLTVNVAVDGMPAFVPAGW